MVFITFENCWNKQNHGTIKTNFHLFGMSPFVECYREPNRGTLLESLFAYLRLIKCEQLW